MNILLKNIKYQELENFKKIISYGPSILINIGSNKFIYFFKIFNVTFFFYFPWIYHIHLISFFELKVRHNNQSGMYVLINLVFDLN